jgi:hypothetical protein
LGSSRSAAKEYADAAGVIGASLSLCHTSDTNNESSSSGFVSSRTASASGACYEQKREPASDHDPATTFVEGYNNLLRRLSQYNKRRPFPVE